MFIQIIPYVKATCQVFTTKSVASIRTTQTKQKGSENRSIVTGFPKRYTLRTTNALQCYKERSEIRIRNSVARQTQSGRDVRPATARENTRAYLRSLPFNL